MINKRYIVSKKLGEGRSKVFSVIDTEFPEREVAAKFLPASASNEEKEFFREEYFILQKLDHPNIIKSFEIGTVLIKEDDEDSELEKFSHFITMEYFQPTALLNYSGLKVEKKLNQIIKQICSALYYLHQSNYIYYDLKAENILVGESNGNPFVKIIDLGFARHTRGDYETNIQGTPYYIAPELLKNENHDYRVDFYSLGMMLYRIVYGKFPFNSENELDIYKAHIEDDFYLGSTVYSKKITNVISKLIRKNPEERYKNALQIILDLQIPIDFEIVKDFIPAKVFSDRRDAFNILSTYLADKSSNEVFTVTGFDGSGKTTLMLEIFRKNQYSVFVENSKIKSGLEAIKYIFHKIILTEGVYYEKQKEYDEIINNLFDQSSNNFIESVKRIFNTLPADINLTLIFDDFNLYDDFTTESLTEIIRILQVKGIKVILTESSDYDHSSSSLNNLCSIQLNQFTDHQLSEFLDFSYYPLYPITELKKYILLYSDLQPGNIKQFIKDLILLRVCRYENAEVSFHSNEDIILSLQSSHEELYRMRLSNLNSQELKLAQIISAFDNSIEQTVLAALLNVSLDRLKSILSELEKKNIIDPLSLSNAPKVNSFNFNKYIYSTISNRSRFHLVLANSIKKLFADFNVMELARQFELANDHEQSIEYLQKEIKQAEQISAYSYKRTLLEKAISLSVFEKTLNKLKFDLINTLYKLSDYKPALQLLDNLSIDKFSINEKERLIFIKGSCLIELGETLNGKNILNLLKSKLTDKFLLGNLLVELAFAELDSNNFEEAQNYCNDILSDLNSSLENRGRVLNLLSMIDIQANNNHQSAIKHAIEALEKFELAKLPRRIAGMHVNIGALYDMVGANDKAEQAWLKALSINSEIGNLEQEGSILINYGVFYHYNNNLEKAIENWELARKIFTSIGIYNKLAIATSNMGEVYMELCDYQNAYDHLILAQKNFRQLGDRIEDVNLLFHLGRLWFLLGDIKELEKILNQFEIDSFRNDEAFEIIDIKYQILNLFRTLLYSKNLLDNDELKYLIERIRKSGDNNLFAYVSLLISEHLIRSNKFNDAKKYLDDQFINEIAKKNVLIKAQREFLFGKLAITESSLTAKPAIEHFEYAYKLIEGESITELTWKVLYEITLIYWERGNFYKAKKPRHYAYELINMIGENISNNKIRTAYFNQPERKKAIEKLIIMGNQTQLNEFQKS